MKHTYLLYLTLLFACAWATPVVSERLTTQNLTVNATIIDMDSPVTSASQAVVWSIIYTNAIASFIQVVGALLQATATNQFIHVSSFPSPESSAVIAPNIDTLYSFAVLDLSENDVVLGIPTINDDRFWNYAVYDLYGNSIVEISSINNNLPGNYRVRQDMTNEVGFTEPTSSEYRADVAVSTAYAVLAIRLGIEATTDADLLQLRTYQNASTLTMTQRSSTGTVPSLSNLGDLSVLQTVEGQLEFTANLIPFNPIQVVSDRSRVEGNLAQAGISDGRFVAPAGVDLEVGQDIANESMIADVSNPENIVILNNGWTMPIPSYQGNYGVNYAVQAVRATSAFQTQTLALYPNQPLIAGSGLDSSNSLLLTFSGKPPVLETGFWNVAAYNADLGLIANPLDRYGIGSRVFNITYANGENVYGPGASAEGRDFQILVQDKATPPPSNWTGNWLPVEDGFSLTFRVYGPSQALKDGSYVWPTVERIPILSA